METSGVCNTLKETAEYTSVDKTQNITIHGRAGSGKTLLCVALAKAMVKNDKNAVLILSNGWNIGQSSPTMSQVAGQIQTVKI